MRGRLCAARAVLLSEEGNAPIVSKVSWKDLRVSTRSGETLVEEMTGEITKGELLAVMGPSGAGKSTFLQRLAGVPISKTMVAGSIYVDEQLTEEPLGLGLGAGATLVEEPLQRGAVAQLHHEMQLATWLDVRCEEARDAGVAQRYADV